MGNNAPPSRPFWRSLDELVGTPQFKAWAGDEFAPEMFEKKTRAEMGASRREMLKLAAASFVLASLASCSRAPEQELVPYVHTPAGRTPARPQHFATTLTRGRESIGVIVTSNEGRPTKIEGNPKHPASLGATDTFAQAEVLGLCDPDRSQAVLHNGQVATWDAFSRELQQRLSRNQQAQTIPSTAHLLTGPITSPSMLDQITRLMAKNPGMKWYVHDPTGEKAAIALRSMFKQDVQPSFDLAAARVIVSFDCDLFFGIPGSVRYARDFANGRRYTHGYSSVNRLYVAEPSPTITGSKADHRRIARPTELAGLIESLAARLGITGAVDTLKDDAWLNAVAKDLEANAGHSLIVAGTGWAVAAHHWVVQMNAALGNIGKTVSFRPSNAPPSIDLASLITDVNAHKVESLIILDTNPVYDAPAITTALANIPWIAHVGLYNDETAAKATWHVPMAHTLESWGDATAFDGTVSAIQPLIAPLYGGKSAMEVLANALGEPLKTDYDLVSDYWRRVIGPASFDAWWRTSLREGVMATPAPAAPVAFDQASIRGLQSTRLGQETLGTNEQLCAVFRPSSGTYDGRYANNAWLQELPDPITKLTWDNAAWLSEKTARHFNVTTGDVVRIRIASTTVEAPVIIVPGQAEFTVTLPLGYGRTKAGSVGSGVGFNAYAFDQEMAFDVELKPAGRTFPLAITQEHSTMEGRDIFRTLVANTPHEKEPKVVHLSMYPDRLQAKQQWGLSIDLTSCIGCNACTIACQSENNIPTVGKEEVKMGREMHWIRIDRYFEGEPEDPAIHHQPVPCMHCEQAPCEPVCPVGATQHSQDGLNEMVYNRCIGTRYCSNNCPYKVRRFNFFQYTDRETESRKISRNPQVTVRSRGVIEKCTYCVQRIRNAQIDADIDPDRPTQSVADGVIQTACQQVCPTQAIVFGDVADDSSRVSKLKALPHDYALLEELNTRPRTTYLAEVRNPNPEIPGPTTKESHA